MLTIQPVLVSAPFRYKLIQFAVLRGAGCSSWSPPYRWEHGSTGVISCAPWLASRHRARMCKEREVYPGIRAAGLQPARGPCSPPRLICCFLFSPPVEASPFTTALPSIPNQLPNTMRHRSPAPTQEVQTQCRVWP